MNRANVLAAEANNAAREANAVSTQTLWWTRAGFLAIVLTLIATAWAAWAAARAASVAEKSLDLFKDAEGGFLAPGVTLGNGNSTYRTWMINRGRAPVTVIHADIHPYYEEPKGPIPFIMHVDLFPTDMMVAEGKNYDFGEFAFEADKMTVYLVGGALYYDFFWTQRLCRIAIRIDRQTGKTTVWHEADFSEWEQLIEKVKPRRWWQGRKRVSAQADQPQERA